MQILWELLRDVVCVCPCVSKGKLVSCNWSLLSGFGQSAVSIYCANINPAAGLKACVDNQIYMSVRETGQSACTFCWKYGTRESFLLWDLYRLNSGISQIHCVLPLSMLALFKTGQSIFSAPVAFFFFLSANIFRISPSLISITNHSPNCLLCILVPSHQNGTRWEVTRRAFWLSGAYEVRNNWTTIFPETTPRMK